MINEAVYTLFDDMRKQPHLMIAGESGSGKSVVINGIITTLLHYDSWQMQMILIDPKRVELSIYKNTPHCIRYASEPDTMVNALRYAMQICESRYKTMQKKGLRMYNGSHLYIIIDEFADLMTTNKREVAPLIQRLAQIGRAARIHIILATQCPLAKVIPTEIKVNFDARVGLRTRSAQDSRNILGYAGLETLARYGQGIYMKPEGDTLYNIPYITDAEQKRIVDMVSVKKKKSFLERIFS